MRAETKVYYLCKIAHILKQIQEIIVLFLYAVLSQISKYLQDKIEQYT
jgi:hypothetical protein